MLSFAQVRRPARELTMHSTAKYLTRLSGSVKHERTFGMIIGK
jgi:hypothetical protein